MAPAPAAAAADQQEQAQRQVVQLKAVDITAENFAPYGQVRGAGWGAFRGIRMWLSGLRPAVASQLTCTCLRIVKRSSSGPAMTARCLTKGTHSWI